MKKIGINGYGRIGRALLRAYFARYSELKDKLQIVAINELTTAENLAYLTEYDSLYGKFNAEISFSEHNLCVNNNSINLQNNSVIEKLNWQNIDILVEASGSFKDNATAYKHLARGASKILFANPATNKVDATIIYGVNHQQLLAQHKVISAGSCTTNCLVPILKILDENYGINSVSATTLHAYMADQSFLDTFSNREQIRMRSAQSILPIATELAKGVIRIMPNLENRIIAQHIRVPSLGVSGMEVCLHIEKMPQLSQLYELLQLQATSHYSGILALNAKNLAAIDFLKNPNSAIVDLNSIKIVQNQLRLFAWFDSEWGFANRLLDILILNNI